MIKLNAMRLPKCSVVICLFIAVLVAYPVNAQTPSAKPVVISPRAGEAVQGRVEINGITELEGFQRAEVEFRYTNDPRGTWFLIGETDQPVNPGKIIEWDTSLITDGNYDLRLTVFLKDGRIISTSIAGIRVRNYSSIETPTPVLSGQVNPDPSRQVTAAPSPTPRPTRPVFAPNPAVLTQVDFNSSLVRGLITTVGFFLAYGIYWIIKKSLS